MKPGQPSAGELSHTGSRARQKHPLLVKLHSEVSRAEVTAYFSVNSKGVSFSVGSATKPLVFDVQR